MATAAHHEAEKKSVGREPVETALWRRDPPRLDAGAPDQGNDIGETAVGELYVSCWRSEPVSDETPEHADEYAAAAGMPGRGVVVVSLLASQMCAALNLALTGGLSLFFDLCFITICLVGAMSVRRVDLFTTGVLAPLVLAAVVLVVAVTEPHAFKVGADVPGAFLTGLAQHAAALVAGYGVALLTVGGRVAARRG